MIYAFFVVSDQKPDANWLIGFFLNYKNNQATSHIIKKTNCSIDSVETLFDGFWSLFAANPACCNVELVLFWCLDTDQINKEGTGISCMSLIF